MVGFEDPTEDDRDIGVPLGLAPILPSLDIRELLALRAEIDTRLPAKFLKDMDLEAEVVIQYQTVKALQNMVLQSGEESNKKAQVANTCAAALQALVKMQSEFHTAERLKNIESRLIKALEKIPAEYLEEFFEWYEKGEF